MSAIEQEADGRRWLAFAVLCAVQLMILIDTSIVSVALRAIQEDLGFSQSGLAWTTNAYTIAFGGLLLLSGRLGDLMGRKRMFLAGVVLFTSASFLCGVSRTQGLLVTGRLLQGIGAAMAAAVVMGIVITLFRDPAEIVKAIGAFSFVAAAGGSIGVLAGGVLTESISWHWIFFINVPIGIAAAVFAIPLIDDDRGPGLREGADWLGAALVTGGLMLGVYTMVNVTEHGWSSAHTLGFGALSVVLLGAFVLRQAATATPLMPLRIFRSRNLSGANLVQLLLTAGMFGFNFLSALYLQQVLGYGPLQAGFASLPVAVALAVVSLAFSPKLNLSFGSRNVLLAGLLLIAGALALAARAPVEAGFWIDVLPMMVLLGAGAGLSMPAVMTLAMSGATPQDAGLVSGLAGTTGMVGGSLGLAVWTALSAGRTEKLLADGHPPLEALNGGFRFVFALSAGVVLVSALVGFLMLRTPVAPAGPPPAPAPAGEAATAAG
ncbi:MFS transporter [Streptomyces galilaeus]|uniref:MFS transporter n=1 Tax=Streptomyces galilaeus TaxID=33899 RepID=UPI00123D5BD7|nr:MFS transporter [Streptomyces galilaeus]QEU65629.1 MFS transporter [Streptomyces galilaeus]GGW73826.1 MFS transporter [Streptomyces galilaeus]